VLKSIAIVIGSYLLSVIFVLVSDPLLSRVFPGEFVSGRVPSNTGLVASTAFFIVVSILCAWVCARFAPNRPGRHVLWFFVLGEVMGLALTLPNWNNGWPHWYWLAWILSWPLSCWIGFLFAGRRAHQPSPATV
jgi:hypothetical protein